MIRLIQQLLRHTPGQILAQTQRQFEEMEQRKKEVEAKLAYGQWNRPQPKYQSTNGNR